MGQQAAGQQGANADVPEHAELIDRVLEAATEGSFQISAAELLGNLLTDLNDREQQRLRDRGSVNMNVLSVSEGIVMGTFRNTGPDGRIGQARLAEVVTGYFTVSSDALHLDQIDGMRGCRGACVFPINWVDVPRDGPVCTNWTC